MGSRIHMCFTLFLFIGFLHAVDRVEAGPYPKSLGRTGHGSKTAHGCHGKHPCETKTRSHHRSGSARASKTVLHSTPRPTSVHTPSPTPSPILPSEPTATSISSSAVLSEASDARQSSSFPASQGLESGVASSTTSTDCLPSFPTSSSFLIPSSPSPSQESSPSSFTSFQSSCGVFGSNSVQSSSIQTSGGPIISSTFSPISSSCTVTAILFLPTFQPTESSSGSAFSAPPSISASEAQQSGQTTSAIPSVELPSATPVGARAISINVPTTSPATLEGSASATQQPSSSALSDASPTTTPIDISAQTTCTDPCTTSAISTTADDCITVTETQYYIPPTSGPTILPPIAGPFIPVPPVSVPTSNPSVSGSRTPGASLSTPISGPLLSGSSTSATSAADESATPGPTSTSVTTTTDLTTTTDFGVRVAASGSVTLSASTTVVTELSFITVASGTNILTTVSQVVRTSFTLVPVPTGKDVPVPTGTDVPALPSFSSSRLQTTMIAGIFGGVAGALLFVLGICFLVRRLRRRVRHSKTSSFFPSRRTTTDSFAALSPSSMGRPPSVLFASSGTDLEEGTQEDLDTLDLAGPMQQVQIRETEVLPYLRMGGGPLNVAVIPPTKEQIESRAASLVESPSSEPEASVSEKGALEARRFGQYDSEGDWLRRPDTMHSNPPPDYISSCLS
ncbi:hypothetical protein B0H13DRAFT_251043 [Mycena leptocephala]|nr:hypothetical protein B0H13DRAFT_251043 [Mycena leptocephala]